MSNILTKLSEVPSSEDPRRAFETAIARIHSGVEHLLPSQTPIAIRRRTSMTYDPTAEKRALSDAARALARLWNISSGHVR